MHVVCLVYSHRLYLLAAGCIIDIWESSTPFIFCCLYQKLALQTVLTHFAIMSLFSDYYNTAARIIVLMEETCNMFIDMARKFLDPGSIFQIEVTTDADQATIKMFRFFVTITCY